MSERNDWEGVEAVGGHKVHRDPTGRVTAVGSKAVRYDGFDRPGTVGGEKVAYDTNGQPIRAGNILFPPLLPPSNPAVDSSYHPAAGLALPGSDDPNSKPNRRPPAGGPDVARRERSANIAADLAVVWVWPVLLLAPTFVLMSLARHDRLPIGPWRNYTTEFFHLAAMFTVAALAMSALVAMFNYKTPAEPDGNGWDVEPLFKDSSAGVLPGIYLALLIPSVFLYSMLALVFNMTPRADFNVWTFLPALVLPGALYLYLQTDYRWDMRRIHHRYFGSVIVSNNNVVHHKAVQDDNGNDTTEPTTDGFRQAVVCYVLLMVLTMFLQGG